MVFHLYIYFIFLNPYTKVEDKDTVTVYQIFSFFNFYHYIIMNIHDDDLNDVYITIISIFLSNYKLYNFFSPFLKQFPSTIFKITSFFLFLVFFTFINTSSETKLSSTFMFSINMTETFTISRE